MLEATNWKGLQPYFREGAVWGEKQDIGVGMHWYSTCMNVRVNMKAANSNHVYYECKICSPFFVKFSRNTTTSIWSVSSFVNHSAHCISMEQSGSPRNYAMTPTTLAHVLRKKYPSQLATLTPANITTIFRESGVFPQWLQKEAAEKLAAQTQAFIKKHFPQVTDSREIPDERLEADQRGDSVQSEAEPSEAEPSEVESSEANTLRLVLRTGGYNYMLRVPSPPNLDDIKRAILSHPTTAGKAIKRLYYLAVKGLVSLDISLEFDCDCEKLRDMEVVSFEPVVKRTFEEISSSTPPSLSSPPPSSTSSSSHPSSSPSPGRRSSLRRKKAPRPFDHDV